MAVAADSTKYAAASIVVPAIEYAGEAPDLGAYESDFLLGEATMPKDPTVLPETPTAISLTPNDQTQPGTPTPNRPNNQASLTVRTTRDGLFIVAVQGAKANDVYHLTVHTVGGQLLGQRSFRAATVVALPGVNGPVLFSVSGPQLSLTQKVAAGR